MAGTLSILNVYEGDVKIVFDKDNPAEAIRARRIILDCIRRGYALLIEVDGAYQRAVDFDEKVGEYIIADFDPTYKPQFPRLKEESQEVTGDDEREEQGEEQKEPEAEEATTKKRGRPRKRIPMEAANAVAVARSAGG